MKIDADALEKLDEGLCALCKNGFRTDVVAAETMVGHDVKGLRSCAMADDVEEAAGFGLGRGEPCCYT